MKTGYLLLVVTLLVCLAVCQASRPLNLRENAPVDEAFVSKITLLDQDALAFVQKRVASELKISQQEAENLRLNFLQWISLNFLINSTSPAATEGPFVPNLKVDDFWHNFILYTKKYQTWCNKHFGHFIHHVPEEEETSENPTAAKHNTDWLKTVALMKDLYGVNWVNDGSCGNCHSLETAGCGNCHSQEPVAGCGSCGTSAGCSGTTTA